MAAVAAPCVRPWLSLLSLLLIKSFSILADKLTLGKTSSKLNEVVEPALSIGCHKLPLISDIL